MDKQLIKLAKTTLLILDKKSWDSIKLDEIYKRLKINNKNLHKQVTNKRDLLRNINRYFDLQLKKTSNSIDQSTHKDMIFEVIMKRFDIIQNYRKSIINVFDFLIRRPKELVCLLPSFVESIILMADLAKIPINGLKGNIKIKGLLIVYLSSFLVWKKDKSKSLEKTMNSLDKSLDQAGKLIRIFNK